MATAIGIRVYQIDVHERGSRKPVPLETSELAQSVPDFIWQFIARHSHVTQNNERERSWYFDSKKHTSRNDRGYIHYGTFGFESNFIDNKTKQHNYRRKVTDIEEIPLYYEFWFPKDEAFGFIAFQSFQGRSCINLTMQQMSNVFEAKNHGHSLRFRKLSINDSKGRGFGDAPVKNLRLIKRNAPSDIADKYFSKGRPETIDVELVFSARRKANLGRLRDLFKSVKNSPNSVVSHEGLDFPEAIAEVRFGNRTRRVNVWGPSGDAGVIDVTESIARGKDGHPTFESLKKEVGEILKNFYEVLSDNKQ